MNKLLADYSKKPIVPTAVVNGAMGIVEDEDYSSTDESDDEDFEQYEQEFVNEEMKKYARFNTEAKSDVRKCINRSADTKELPYEKHRKLAISRASGSEHVKC